MSKCNNNLPHYLFVTLGCNKPQLSFFLAKHVQNSVTYITAFIRNHVKCKKKFKMIWGISFFYMNASVILRRSLWRNSSIESIKNLVPLGKTLHFLLCRKHLKIYR